METLVTCAAVLFLIVVLGAFIAVAVFLVFAMGCAALDHCPKCGSFDEETDFAAGVHYCNTCGASRPFKHVIF